MAQAGTEQTGGQQQQTGEQTAPPDAGQQQTGDQQTGGQQQTGEQQNDKGYPAGTAISEMTAEQRAAYFEEKSRTEENRRKELLKVTGGKYGEVLQKDMEELAKLRAERMTDHDKQLEQTRAEVRAEMATQNVRTAFQLVFPDTLTDEQQNEALGVLNLSAFLTPDGQVDTAKVRAHAARIAPAKDTGTQQRDFGQGQRRTPSDKSGVAAGADMFAAKKKPPTSS